MVSENTEGIIITVETQYQVVYSNPLEQQYVFAYYISIKNESGRTVQLLRRHWYISEESGFQQEVEGPGVIGQTPILEPGDIHQYESGCHLRSLRGSMRGTYLMQPMPSGEKFTVNIPEFTMVVPEMFH